MEKRANKITYCFLYKFLITIVFVISTGFNLTSFAQSNTNNQSNTACANVVNTMGDDVRSKILAIKEQLDNLTNDILNLKLNATKKALSIPSPACTSSVPSSVSAPAPVLNQPQAVPKVTTTTAPVAPVAPTSTVNSDGTITTITTGSAMKAKPLPINVPVPGEQSVTIDSAPGTTNNKPKITGKVKNLTDGTIIIDNKQEKKINVVGDTWSYDPDTELSVGEHKIIVKAFNKDKLQTKEVTGSINILAEPKVEQIVTIDPSPGTTNNKPKITGKVKNLTDGTIIIDDQKEKNISVVGDTWSYEPDTVLSEGEHKIVVKAFNKGKPETKEVKGTIDILAEPTVTMDAVPDSNNKRPILKGTANNAESVVIKIGDGDEKKAVLDGKAWHYELDKDLPDDISNVIVTPKNKHITGKYLTSKIKVDKNIIDTSVKGDGSVLFKRIGIADCPGRDIMRGGVVAAIGTIVNGRPIDGYGAITNVSLKDCANFCTKIPNCVGVSYAVANNGGRCAFKQGFTYSEVTNLKCTANNGHVYHHYMNKK